MTTTTAAFCPLSLQTIFDLNGDPVVGARLTFFDAGTTTARQSYTDAGLVVSATSPVLTDGYGRVPAIFLGTGAYRLVVTDADGALIMSVDGLPGATITSDSETTADGGVPTGFIMAGYTGDQIDGWLIANGKTIGATSSSGSARAADDTRALFSVLWNSDPTLAVDGGRGTSATTDFDAGKTIALPDFRGRSLFGRDGMGAGAFAGLITAVTTANFNILGAEFGAEAHTVGTDQLPAHTHGVAIAPAGGHTPTGTTDNQGSHTHSGSVDGVGNHAHGYTQTVLHNDGDLNGAGSARPWVETTLSNTDAAGAHTHTYTTPSAGGHTHTLTMAAVADHTHTVTENSVGGAQALATMPPGVLVTWYIKL